MDRRCDQCLYCYKSEKPYEALMCRRFPSAEPVSSTYWCGEFKDKSDYPADFIMDTKAESKIKITESVEGACDGIP